MNNEKLISIDGRKVPVSKVKHWTLAPGRVESWGREMNLLEAVKDAWLTLDASSIPPFLSERFTYGSYWVSDSLDKTGYLDYLPKKFSTIRQTDSRPILKTAVVFESLTPNIFPYALHLTQGNVETLLVFTFRDGLIDSLYMTDPEIFTFEPTFRKGGILDDNGEPRIFTHSCPHAEKETAMPPDELQAFATDCVAGLFVEAGADVSKIYRGPCEEYPNIVVHQGSDTFYHRIRASCNVNTPVSHHPPMNALAEFAATAARNGARPSLLDVELWCFDTEGHDPLRGGGFAAKISEAAPIPTSQSF